MNAVKDISGALVHKIPDHPILPLSMPEVLQLFTNEFVSNICVRNICLVMRRYNNTFFEVGKFSILTFTSGGILALASTRDFL